MTPKSGGGAVLDTIKPKAFCDRNRVEMSCRPSVTIHIQGTIREIAVHNNYIECYIHTTTAATTLPSLISTHKLAIMDIKQEASDDTNFQSPYLKHTLRMLYGCTKRLTRNSCI